MTVSNGCDNNPIANMTWKGVEGADSYSIELQTSCDLSSWTEHVYTLPKTAFAANASNDIMHSAPFAKPVGCCCPGSCDQDEWYVRFFVTPYSTETGDPSTLLDTAYGCGPSAHLPVACCPNELTCPPEQTHFLSKNGFVTVTLEIPEKNNCNDSEWYDDGSGTVECHPGDSASNPNPPFNWTFEIDMGTSNPCCDNSAHDDGGGIPGNEFTCGPYSGAIDPANTVIAENVLTFTYKPNSNHTSLYATDGEPELPWDGGPDEVWIRATDCCGEVVCCKVNFVTTAFVCEEDDYTMCDATIQYLSEQFQKVTGKEQQLPFSMNRKGGQTIGAGRVSGASGKKRAYVVTKGINPLKDFN
jgi:hypothetical protein